MIVTCFGDVYAVTVGTVSLPTTYVFFSSVAPKAISLHSTVLEVTHVVFLVEGKQSTTVWFIVHEFTEVSGS